MHPSLPILALIGETVLFGAAYIALTKVKKVPHEALRIAYKRSLIVLYVLQVLIVAILIM
jgi:cytochrome bd-type quinol oxidase subunit 2